MPWEQVAKSNFIVSEYFQQLYSVAIANIATVFILIITLAGLFSAILGYSRIPYAAAINGDFFSVFAKVHPRHNFPHISLLAIGGLAFIFSLIFKLGDVIIAILTMRILVQFASQAIGLIAWHYRHKESRMPYRMPLFPLPAVISIIIWLFIYFTSDSKYILSSLGIIGAGIIAFYIRKVYMPKNKFP